MREDSRSKSLQDVGGKGSKLQYNINRQWVEQFRYKYAFLAPLFSCYTFSVLTYWTACSTKKLSWLKHRLLLVQLSAEGEQA